MNLDQNKKFENELRALRPSPPRKELADRIEEGIRQAESRQRATKWWSGMAWLGMAAAASILIVFGVSLFRSTPMETDPIAAGEPETAPPLELASASSEAPVFEPVLAQNNLQQRVDEGIVFLKNGLTARKYRYTFVDRVVWRNPANGAVVDVEVPRDEVVLVPVQTF